MLDTGLDTGTIGNVYQKAGNPFKSEQSFKLGMPELAYKGVSEQWLLKNLGHVHWELIAQSLGQKDPTFVDRNGNDVYAAFCAIQFDCPGIGQADLNDQLMIESQLFHISAARLLSRHSLMLNGEKIGTVRMISTFVHRLKKNDNASVARVNFPVAHLMLQADDADLEFAKESAKKAAHMRHETHIFDNNPRTYQEKVCPSLDFNGAQLFYFPSFPRIAEKAIRTISTDLSPAVVALKRDMIFLGNVNIDEVLTCQINQQPTEENHMTTQTHIFNKAKQCLCFIASEYGA